MINKMKYVWLSIVSAIFMLFMGCGSNADVSVQTSKTEVQTEIESVAEDIEELESEVTYTIDYDGVYTTKEDVALFIYTYDELPQNFITKKEAKALGWEGGSLEPYAPGMCIGGDKFGNYEGLLPEDVLTPAFYFIENGEVKDIYVGGDMTTKIFDGYIQKYRLDEVK